MRSENGRGQSALHLAALAQSPETLELLLTKGKFPPMMYRVSKTLISVSVWKKEKDIVG